MSQDIDHRPRLLLISVITELEWIVKPLLGEWAEVASFDPPGVGDEPASSGPFFKAVAARGLAELDRRGWESCVVVADELGIAAAVGLAQARPRAVEGLALGHACLSFRRAGERAPLNAGVFDAFMQLVHVDYRAFVSQDLQIWDPRRDEQHSALDLEGLVDRWVDRVPQEAAEKLASQIVAELDALEEFEPALRALGLPLLLVQHQGCPAFTSVGYEDAIAAFPEARSVRLPVTPNASPEFADALQSFCEKLAASRAERETPTQRPRD
jgi:hypothetical protein